MVEQPEIHRKSRSEKVEERKEAAEALRFNFANFPDKKQAWEDLHKLTQDEKDDVRMRAADALGSAYSHIPDEHKQKAWDDLMRLTQDGDEFVRIFTAGSLYTASLHTSNKNQTWNDLMRLTQDEDKFVRKGAASALGNIFSHMPDIKQTWEDLHRLTADEDVGVRMGATSALGAAFSHVPDMKQAWDDLHRLTFDNERYVRGIAASALGVAFSNIPDIKQTWDDMHRLTTDENSCVREHAASALGAAFSYIPDKKQAWEDLHRLTSDDDREVRVDANHSSGRASIFRATKTKSEKQFRAELEKALEFFEKASKESTYYNPSSFCLPFYRSFHAITFRKEEAEADVKKYLGDAKKAVEGSGSKEKLLEAVENLSNALKEAQKAKTLDESKFELNAYRKYCERAADLLTEVEGTAPGAARVCRMALPIIDERIQGIIGEIREKAAGLCKQVKDTEFKEIGKQVNKVGQELSKVIDPIRLEKEVSRMLIPIYAMCKKMPEEDRGEACELLKLINAEQNVEDKLPLISMFLSKISTQMKIQNQEQKFSSAIPEKESIKKPAISIDEKIQQKNDSIEQILDNWGFRPDGFSRGKREEKKADIEKWLRRFLPSEFEDAFLILEQIQYHDSHTVDGYIEGLSRELNKVFDGDLSEIIFYPLGESPSSSGGNLLYSYRKNLGLPESSFPYDHFKKIDLSGKKAIVFFDDIIGSGNQAVRFAKKHLQDIKIDKYYVALMAFEKGYERVRKNGTFKKVIVHEIIPEELKAFSPESQVFPDAGTRERIKTLCEKYGKLLYPEYPLGFDDSQALIVFPHNTPNNTLPIIWASDKNEKEPGIIWYPVWERKKELEARIKEQNHQIMKQPICVHLRSSAVRDLDKLRLHRMPIGAPNSIKYLTLSSYEFVWSSLFKLAHSFAFFACFAVNILFGRLHLIPIVAPSISESADSSKQVYDKYYE